MTELLRIEYHCHTIYSPDSLTKIEDLLRVCDERGIDRVVITDHNTIAGAEAAQKIAPERVIVGEEIRTTQGELLAAFVLEEIPEGLDPFDVIERLREQGAFISVSHPFDRRGGYWDRDVLAEIAPLVDAVEVFNSRCIPRSLNSKAAAFAKQHGLMGTVGSDAHGLVEVGRATMRVPYFEGVDDFRKKVMDADYDVRESGLDVRLISRYAKIRKQFLRK